MRHRTGAETTTMKHEDPATGADGASSAPAPRPGPMLQIAAAATSGLAFGWALHKGGTFEPETIRAQFLFRDWTMMKVRACGVQRRRPGRVPANRSGPPHASPRPPQMFLSAAASSTLAIQFMHLLPATRAAVVESSKAVRAISCSDRSPLAAACAPWLRHWGGVGPCGACDGSGWLASPLQRRHLTHPLLVPFPPGSTWAARRAFFRAHSAESSSAPAWP